MAKCGCQSTQCNCVIQAGPGATVTGSGSAGNPYVIGAADAGNFQVNDSTTVDHTLTGDGSSGTPYELTSAVKLSAAPGNIINVNGDGLVVDCAAVAECVPPAGNVTLGCGLEGTGAPASPIKIKGLLPWDWACAESEGTQLYCGTDGALLGPPPNSCSFQQVGLGPVVGMAGFCGLVPNTAVRTRLSTQPNRMTFNNPDLCRQMILELKAAGVIWMTGDGADGTNPNQWINQLLIGLMIGGVAGSVVQQSGILGDGFLSYRIDYPPITVPAGGSVQIGSFVDGQSDVACHVENAQFQHPNIIATGRTCG